MSPGISVIAPSLAASIRPRLRSRGDGRYVALRERADAASIRPRLRSRGDQSSRVALRSAHGSLQFGHGCGAVEIAKGQTWKGRRIVMLQFGHGCGAVEIRSAHRKQK